MAPPFRPASLKAAFVPFLQHMNRLSSLLVKLLIGKRKQSADNRSDDVCSNETGNVHHHCDGRECL